jgi:hypothetical protein
VVYIYGGEFISTGCSFGASPLDDNSASDVTADSVNGLPAEFSYGDNVSFSCDETGCPENSCTDGVDDNGNGFVDCDDYSCAADPACAQGSLETCNNGVDADGDGDIDCADVDCNGQFVSGPLGTGVCEFGTELSCDDGFDNDGLGIADCGDPDCAADPACNSTAEVCQDGIDNDGDGYADCNDVTCYNAWVGQTTTFASAVEDWVTPACPGSPALSLTTNDLLFVDTSAVDGCVRYYTDLPGSGDLDTLLTHTSGCASLGFPVTQCNDDIDFSAGDYLSEVYIDHVLNESVYLYVSKYAYSDTASSNLFSVEKETPQICYDLTMGDSYGDGWNGGSLTVTQGSVSTVYSNTLSASAGTPTSEVATVCLDASTFTVTWTSGSWDSEVSFDFTTPSSAVVCPTSNPASSDPCGGDIVPTCAQL